MNSIYTKGYDYIYSITNEKVIYNNKQITYKRFYINWVTY